ncbi:unnamed protein product, partial [Polarella glacialis]
GAAASMRGRYRPGGSVKGSKICDDGELQDMLAGWEKLGVSFSGVMLQAESKDTATAYCMEKDSWTATDTIVGETALLLKTTGDGWLQLRLNGDMGFRWEHCASYRFSSSKKVGAGQKTNSVQLHVVDSSTKGFEIDDFRELLEGQRTNVYGPAGGSSTPFEDFAKRLFEALGGRKCEGKRPMDPLQGGPGRQGGKGAHGKGGSGAKSVGKGSSSESSGR